MFRIDAADTAPSKPTRGALGTPGHFKSGDPQNGVLPTEVTAEWLEATQEELIALATLRGASLDKANDGQAADALFATRALAAPTDQSGATTAPNTPTLRASLGGGGSGGNTQFKAGGGTSIDIAGDGNTLGGERSAMLGCDDSTADPSTGDGDNLGAVGVASRFADVGGSQSVVMASNGAKTRGAQTAVIASESAGADPVLVDGTAAAALAAGDSSSASPPVVHGTRSAIIASDQGGVIDAAAHECAVIASKASRVTGARGQAAALSCLETDVAGSIAAAVGSAHSLVSGSSVLLGSDYVELHTADCIGGGRDVGPLVPAGADQNLTWRMQCDDGELYLHGSAHAGGLDYAETFENVDEGEIPVGALVARTGAKVRPTKAGDRIVGVISATPALLGDPAALNWIGKFKRDEWGRVLTDDVPFVSWPELGTTRTVDATPASEGVEAVPAHKVRDVTRQGYNGQLAAAPLPIPDDAEHRTVKIGQVAEGFTRGQAYTPRAKRPAQWSIVGLLGQLRVRVTADVTEGDDLAAGDGGLGVPATSKAAPRGAQLEVMAILAPFNAERGYAIALCLVR